MRALKKLLLLVPALNALVSPVLAKEHNLNIGESINFLLKSLGTDATNYIFTFGLVASAVYFAGHTLQVSRGHTGGDQKVGPLGVFAGSAGFAAAYWVWDNDIDFIAVITPWLFLLVGAFLLLLIYNFIKTFEAEHMEGRNMLFGGIGLLLFGVIGTATLTGTWNSVSTIMTIAGVVLIGWFIVRKVFGDIGGGNPLGGGTSGGSSTGRGFLSGRIPGTESRRSRLEEQALGARSESDISSMFEVFADEEQVLKNQILYEEEFFIPLLQKLNELKNTSVFVDSPTFTGYAQADKERYYKEIRSKLQPIVNELEEVFKKLNASKNRIQADTKRLRGLYKKVEKDIRVLEGVEHQEAREARRNELKKFRVRIEVYDRYVEQHEKDIHFIEEADISGLKSALSDLKTMRGPAGSTGANKAYDKIYRIVERIQQLKGEWKWLGKIEKLESLSNEQDRALIEGRGDARAGALG